MEYKEMWGTRDILYFPCSWDCSPEAIDPSPLQVLWLVEHPVVSAAPALLLGCYTHSWEGAPEQRPWLVWQDVSCPLCFHVCVTSFGCRATVHSLRSVWQWVRVQCTGFTRLPGLRGAGTMFMRGLHCTQSTHPSAPALLKSHLILVQFPRLPKGESSSLTSCLLLILSKGEEEVHIPGRLYEGQGQPHLLWGRVSLLFIVSSRLAHAGILSPVARLTVRALQPRWAFHRFWGVWVRGSWLHRSCSAPDRRLSPPSCLPICATETNELHTQQQ